MDLDRSPPYTGEGRVDPNLTGGIRVLLDTPSPFINVPGDGHYVRTAKQQRHQILHLVLTTDDFGHP